MKFQELQKALEHGRPKEEYSCDVKADVVIDDVDWHAPTTKPTQAELDQFLVDYQAWAAAGGEKEQTADNEMNNAVYKTIVDAFHELENRVRALEGVAPPATKAQVRDWLKNKYRDNLP